MEQTAHTPGPWRWTGLEGDNRGEIMGGNGGIVAFAAWCNDSTADLVIDNPADARLIDAAPAMLAALEDTLAHFESIIARIEDGARLYAADRNALDFRFREARAAIAQARGGREGPSVSAPHCSGCRTDSTGIVLCCPLHAEADTAIGLLRRLVEEYEYLDLSDTQMLRITIRGITDAARPLFAAIDGAAHAHEKEG